MIDQVFEAFQLEGKFVHLENDGEMTSHLVDKEFWSEGSSRGYLGSGRLMGILKLDAGPSHWEVHPEGDELLYYKFVRPLLMYCAQGNMAPNNCSRAVQFTVHHSEQRNTTPRIVRDVVETTI